MNPGMGIKQTVDRYCLDGTTAVAPGALSPRDI